MEEEIVCAVLTGITNATSESLNRLAKLESPPRLRLPQPREPAQARPHRLHPRNPAPVTHPNHRENTHSNKAETPIPVNFEEPVFTEAEALALLSARTGLADTGWARRWLPSWDSCLWPWPRPPPSSSPSAWITQRTWPAAPDAGRRILPPALGGQYPRGVAAAIALSLQLAADGDETGMCQPVMGLLAVLSPAGVPRSLLHAAAAQGLLGGNSDGPLSAEVADRALGRLNGASLLNFTVEGSGIVAHRLVLRVVRELLADTHRLAAVCQAAAALLDAHAEALHERWFEDRMAARDLVTQIAALHQASNACRDDDALTRTMLALRFHALWFMNELGDSVVQAIAVGDALLADQEQILGAEHQETLKAANSLALAYQDVGRIGEAIALQERTLASREKTLGPDHPDTLISANNLAAAYRDAGRAGEAVALFEGNLAGREKTLGPAHSYTMASRNNLAAVYLDAGRVSEAIALHERNLADREEILGASHPHTLITCDNLAIAYQQVGRISEAIALHERALGGLEEALGPDHPFALDARGDLAAAYLKAGQTGKAITLYEHTLASREKVLGPDHPHTLAARDNLASARQAASQPEIGQTREA